MEDRSAHESGGQDLVKTRLRRPQRWRKGMEVKEEFGPAQGEEEAGWAKRNVSFLCRGFLLFCLADWGEGDQAAPVWHCQSGMGYGYMYLEKPTKQRPCGPHVAGYKYKNTNKPKVDMPK